MNPIITLLQAEPGYFLAIIFILGLLVGSFLNVVIYRLPIMMQRQWKQECSELLDINTEKSAAENAAAEEKYNLVVPRSRCPHCDHSITALENIPVISYLALRGKCPECRKSISPRYPIIELFTGIISLAVAWHFGFSWQTAFALLLSWALIAMSAIDIEHQLLPDSLTLPFMWLGLIVSLGSVFISVNASLIGAVAGYLVLWLVFHIFHLITGKEGMGYGDFKLLALLGAWLGWHMLPIVILLSSVVGAIVGISMIVILGRDKNIPIPFGPYLAAAGWISLLWGEQIMAAYLTYL
ncbi:MAG: prepilin peptidase [Gammaproteobacteria bacterium]|nr:prepilin peptidase [Gammaproteobacteria bacterium]